MIIPTLSTFAFANLTIRYPWDPETGRVGLEIVPTALLEQIQPRRDGLAGLPYIDAMPDAGNPPAYLVDSLAQVKIVGDWYPGAFSQGHTMRNSPSVDAFSYERQDVTEIGDRTIIATFLKSSRGHRLEHRLSWFVGAAAVEIETTFSNDSEQPVTLEMLSSFSLGGLSPFDPADNTERLLAHRFRSVWSAEGRLETRSIEELHLERSWSGAGMFSERFGQVGSMPVRKWFPFLAIEDTISGVVWGAQLAWAGSWQMEIFRQHDDLSISGGLADREFGHWMKTLQPGEKLTTPPATLSCVQGNLDDLCDRLTAVQNRAVDLQPTIEQELPIVFNEWCTTWGDPQHDKVVAIADRLQGSAVRFLVIDAGWYKAGSADWSSGHGDWVPNPRLFPQGLTATAKAIRERGLIPGLWFEMETVGSRSEAFYRTDLLLLRDGLPVTVRERRFWDLNKPAAVAYLVEKVIDVLEAGDFGYLKVDYNETIGLGSDDPDGLGEGLRKQIEGVYRFFELIRQRLPDLVIENCSSGGHRLEPSMLARTAMSSFSDAHELVEIPIIAASLQRLLLPRQSQIWAVLHRSDSDTRLLYSLAATFLGRMCLSGDIADLTDAQMEIVTRAETLYRKVALIIKNGTSRRFGQLGSSWRHPVGWQAVVRVAADRKTALIVVHAFGKAPLEIEIPLPDGHWQVRDQLESGTFKISPNILRLPVAGDFSANVLLLEALPS